MEKLWPHLNFLKVWRCLAKIGLLDFKKSNIGPKFFDCVFIGYTQHSAAYRFMSINDFSICKSRDVEFFESIFPLRKYISNNIASSSNTLVLPASVNYDFISKEHDNEPRRSKR